jgi:bifunctional DNA-binding transcriptional regulator/antitoxin component of YhaV-PrlF toxin-antitoxin module
MSEERVTLTKELKSREEHYLEFTDEELTLMNIKKGDKFTWEITDDGVLLKKYETIEINLSDFSEELKDFIISESVKKDITVNEFIIECLKEFLV